MFPYRSSEDLLFSNNNPNRPSSKQVSNSSSQQQQTIKQLLPNNNYFQMMLGDEDDNLTSSIALTTNNNAINNNFNNNAAINNNLLGNNLFISSREQLHQGLEYINSKLINNIALLPIMNQMNDYKDFKIDFNKKDNDVFIVNIIYYLLKDKEEDQLLKSNLQDKYKRLQCDFEALNLNTNKLSLEINNLKNINHIEKNKQTTLQNEYKNKYKRIEAVKNNLEIQNKNLLQKCDQFEHNLIKLEKEYNKLKQQLNTKITSFYNTSNLNSSVINNSKIDVINENKLKLGLERNEDLLYQNIVEAFKDEKQEILAENYQLRKTLKFLNQQLNYLLSFTNYNNNNDETYNKKDILSSGDELFELPYYLAQEEVESSLQGKMNELKQFVVHQSIPNSHSFLAMSNASSTAATRSSSPTTIMMKNTIHTTTTNSEEMLNGNSGINNILSMNIPPIIPTNNDDKEDSMLYEYKIE
ncbi:hypothetical protein ABK040_011973 [Willaertia magna]